MIFNISHYFSDDFGIVICYDVIEIIIIKIVLCGDMEFWHVVDLCSSDLLLIFCRIGYVWIRQLLTLGCYAMLLMPGFLQGMYYVICVAFMYFISVDGECYSFSCFTLITLYVKYIRFKENGRLGCPLKWNGKSGIVFISHTR